MKQKDIVQYFQRDASSPIITILIAVINAGYCATWSGLTTDLVRKHLDKSPATTKGHMKQLQMNTRSTTKPTTTHVMMTPTPSEDVQASSNITIKVLDVGTIYSIKQGVFLSYQSEVTGT